MCHHHRTLCSTWRGQSKYVSFLLNPLCEGMLPVLNMNRDTISGMFLSDSLLWQTVLKAAVQAWVPSSDTSSQAVLWGEGVQGRQHWWGDSTLDWFPLENLATSTMFQFCYISSRTNTSENLEHPFPFPTSLQFTRLLFSTVFIQFRKDHAYISRCSSFLSHRNITRFTRWARFNMNNGCSEQTHQHPSFIYSYKLKVYLLNFSLILDIKI